MGIISWSETPDDILDKIVQELSPCLEDFVKFGAVCKSWRSVHITNKINKPASSFSPWLMLAKEENDNIEGDEEAAHRTLFSLSSQKVFNLQLPETQGRRCWGSAYGYLLTLGLDLNIHLFNPLSRTRISLPPQPTFPPYYWEHNADDNLRLCMLFIYKFALASHPPTTLVMAIYGISYQLVFATPGDETWTSIQYCDGNRDVIFFNGQFYVINFAGILKVCELNTTPPKATDIAFHPSSIEPTDTVYLIEISGHLHLVARIFTSDEIPGEFHYNSKLFIVFKFDFHTKEWSEVYDLDDYALFVGNNASFAISTTTYSAFKGNCIYFTDDHNELYWTRYSDMGVFDYEMETVEPFYSSNDAPSKFSRPLFFMPSFG